MESNITGHIHADVVETNGAVNIEPEASIICELLEVGWTLAFIFARPQSANSILGRLEGEPKVKLTITIELACAADG